jgi:ABC-type branched-subunit amino acid transport system substrate-binding protein
MSACLGTALVLLAAACGSSKKAASSSTTSASSGTSSGASSTPTQGVTDTAITVGGVTVIQGQGFTYVDQCNGAEIYFKKINAEGGVNGRKINYVGCLDDQASTSMDNTQTQRLIQQDKVFAIVPASIVFTGYTFATQANVPYFGWGISPYFCDNSQGFGFNGCTGPTSPNWISPTWGKLMRTVSPNAKRAAFIAPDIPPGRVTLKAISAGAQSLGYDIVYSSSSVPLAGVADWTPYAQQIIQSHPDVVFNLTQESVPLTAALRAGGYKGPISDAVSYSPALLGNQQSAQALDGEYVITSTAPFESQNAGIQQMISDVRKYGASGQALTDPLSQGYFSAMLFVDIVKQAGKNLTYDSFYKVANGGNFCDEFNGALGKLCYPIGHKNSSGCNAMVQITNGKFEPKQPITCAPAPGNSTASNDAPT